MSPLYKPYQNALNVLKGSEKYRALPDLSSASTPSSINFSTNDYLCLRDHPEILEAAHDAGKLYGTGATGSRLLSGNKRIFEAFESQIALDKGAESALLFNSGFQANFSVLSSLLDPKTLGTQALVFFDKLNHASLYQAIFLSRAQLVRYPHNNMDALARTLAKMEKDPRPKFIVTETIFGMDGDIASLTEIITLARKYNAFLYLDEAHATGIFGPNGYGLATSTSFSDIPHMIMGTFSKALGGSGAYIACPALLKKYIVNKCLGFVYSTAPSPMVIGAAAKAWEMVSMLGEERLQLASKASYLRSQLRGLGFDTGPSASHIIPIWLGQESASMQAKRKLLEQGIIVSAVRPPTVPPNTSRLRIALTINHTMLDIEQLLFGLKTL